MGTPRRSLMFRLGQFFGHVARGATGSIAPGESRRVLRHDVEEQTSKADGATVTLRRTTIEEVEVRPDAARAADRAGDNPQQEGSR